MSGLESRTLGRQTSGVNAQNQLTIPGPHRVDKIVVNYDGDVSATVTVVTASDGGSAYDALELSQEFDVEQHLTFYAPRPIIVPRGHQLVVTAPAVAAVTSAIEVIGW